MTKNKSRSIYFNVFLLYVGIMFIITFLQQEYVILPEIQSVDIWGEETWAQFLEKYQKLRWLGYIFSPLLLAIRICLVSVCFLLGSYFFPEMSGKKFKDWLDISVLSQSVLVTYSIFLCVFNISVEPNQAMAVSKHISLLFLANDSADQWIKIPLTALNVFEIAYWFMLAILVSKSNGTKFGYSFKFVMSTYGIGYLFYIVLMMFVVLYFGN